MHDISQRCNEILDLLEEEAALHRDLLDLSRREQGLLVSFDVDALTATLREVEALIGKVRAVMNARLALLGEVTRSLGRPGGAASRGSDRVSCEEVMASAGDGCLERYRSILQQLAPILEEHAVINGGNIVLINNILDYVDFATRVYACRDGRNTYSVNTTALRRKAGRPHAFHFSRP
ncbi:MAG TPA: flagellar protein FlgN [Firmicutes bacterium]|nr:flagellar protein FlgN [Bacillota bacterium]